jgi:hypothetical protein
MASPEAVEELSKSTGMDTENLLLGFSLEKLLVFRVSITALSLSYLPVGHSFFFFFFFFPLSLFTHLPALTGYLTKIHSIQRNLND